MAYNWKNVKPHVVQVADMLAKKHGIATIYGWRPIDPFPDHPSGLAVDFMTGGDRSKGDALAADAVANAGAYGIKYIIWWHRVWNPKQGWHPYTSTGNPHTDHVHITWNATPGAGTVADVQQLGNPIQGASDAAEKLASFITNKQNWVRASMFIVGTAMILIVLVRVTGTGGAIRKAVIKA